MSVLRQILGAAAGRTGSSIAGRVASASTRRAANYSSFSGRYFNSTGKPGSKGAVVAAKTNNSSKAKELQPAPQDAQQTNIHLVIEPDFASIQSSTHPVITPQDLKLHQFFSLHRPLLLIHTPPSLFTPPSSTFESSLASQTPRQLTSIFDDPVDTQGIDADVEAARQLARGLTINKAGPAVAWEQTLQRLGLDPAADPERVEMQGQMVRDREDVQILLDSTKRKRRSKMKKHKLKKRRKATRAARLKLK